MEVVRLKPGGVNAVSLKLAARQAFLQYAQCVSCGTIYHKKPYVMGRKFLSPIGVRRKSLMARFRIANTWSVLKVPTRHCASRQQTWLTHSPMSQVNDEVVPFGDPMPEGRHATKTSCNGEHRSRHPYVVCRPHALGV